MKLDNVVRPLLEQKSGKEEEKDFGICVNPEFISESTAIHDFYHPPLPSLGLPAIRRFDLKETRFSAGDAAVYVEPNKEFAKTIVGLMEQPDLRKRMGDFGRRRAENELQWSKVGKNLLTAYETLLDGKESPEARSQSAIGAKRL